ncbi:hypothetical protein LMG28138_01943 [Pararobbsia alpina]|uniref:Fimbrial-type adhesion domain-containing protein n=2 Tax=Pararobbsia alpina TaxID=621374 RepID=A0A6S7B1U3_9BURK|nr:hypothetical protein LMG28138_01943 [Pararobbsia alpina]
MEHHIGTESRPCVDAWSGLRGRYCQAFWSMARSKYSLTFLGILFSGTISYSAHASVSCTVVTPVVTFPLPAQLTVAQNVPFGQALTNWQDRSEVQTHDHCVFSDNTKAGSIARSSNASVGTVSDAGTTYEVFKSPAPGIGYIMKGKDRYGSWTPIGRRDTYLTTDYSSSYDSAFSVKLVATGQPMVTGQTPGFQAGLFEITDGNDVSAPTLLNMPTISVRAQTCRVRTSAVEFQLPRIAPRDLPAVGSVAGATKQTIEISCGSVLDVYMVISDVTNPGNRTSTLTLSPGSTASGVGIEVLYLGKRVSFGPDSSVVGTQNEVLVKSNLKGTGSIWLTAQYVRTASNLREGSVKALATFTLSYR